MLIQGTEVARGRLLGFIRWHEASFVNSTTKMWEIGPITVRRTHTDWALINDTPGDWKLPEHVEWSGGLQFGPMELRLGWHGRPKN